MKFIVNISIICPNCNHRISDHFQKTALGLLGLKMITFDQPCANCGAKLIFEVPIDLASRTSNGLYDGYVHDFGVVTISITQAEQPGEPTAIPPAEADDDRNFVPDYGTDDNRNLIAISCPNPRCGRVYPVYFENDRARQSRYFQRCLSCGTPIDVANPDSLISPLEIRQFHDELANFSALFGTRRQRYPIDETDVYLFKKKLGLSKDDA